MTTVSITPASGKTCTAAEAITNWRVSCYTFTWIILQLPIAPRRFSFI